MEISKGNLSFESIAIAHVALIVKKLFMEINKNKKDLIKYSSTLHGGLCDGSMRYWKAQDNVDKTIRYVNNGYMQLLVLDDVCRWSENLHQDRFKFVEKYPEILRDYLDKREVEKSIVRRTIF